MKSRIRRPASDVGLLKRAQLLGARLDIPMPLIFVGEEMTRWWAEIGKALAEQQPEFSPGPGRRPGSKNKSVKAVVEASTIRQRRSRLKKRIGGLNKRKRADAWVQIGSQSYLLPEDVVAGLRAIFDPK